jgi:hypothetical protein
VEVYSRRRLTYSKDKLSALSGIAHTISDFTRGYDEYLAWLWKLSLPRYLCWFPGFETFKSPHTEPAGERDEEAPSWSWASFPGAVSYHQVSGFAAVQDLEDEEEEACGVWECQPLKIIATYITPDGVDLFGRVASGSKIVLSSIVVDIEINESYYVPRFYTHTPELKCYFMFKGPGLPGISISKEYTAIYDHREAIADGYVCFNVNPRDLRFTTFRCLRLGKGVTRMNQGEYTSTIGNPSQMVDTGLVLLQVENTDDCKRVGIFEVAPNNDAWSSKGKFVRVGIV